LMTRWQDLQRKRARLKRRGLPIHIYVGPNGHGKSLLATYDTLPDLDFGRPVLSTVRLLDFRNPRDCQGGRYCDDPENHLIRKRRVTLVEHSDGPPTVEFSTFTDGELHKAPHPYYVPLRSYRQLMDWRDGTVFFDEATGGLSSRQTLTTPPEIQNLLMQLRRRNVTLRITAPTWNRIDVLVREVAQGVTLVEGHIGKRRKVAEGEAPILWKDRRFFIARTYDPLMFDEFDHRRAVGVVPEISQWLWRPGALTERAFDTRDSVSSVGAVDMNGSCVSCGGRRALVKCSCDDHTPSRMTGAHLSDYLAELSQIAVPAPAVLVDGRSVGSRDESDAVGSSSSVDSYALESSEHQVAEFPSGYFGPASDTSDVLTPVEPEGGVV
jgi:hypothetical protein